MSAFRLFRSGAPRRLQKLPQLAKGSKMASDHALGILPPDILIEEETMPDYDASHFYPLNPGDLLHGRYQILAKLGWGSSSTV